MRTIEEVVDAGSFELESDDLVSNDPLGYPGYRDDLEAAREKGSDESVVTGSARIGGHPVEMIAFDFRFIAGSIGEVAGERIARALERGAERGTPVVLRTATGGSRMQEGMRSLVQMPKMIIARNRLARSRQPLIALLGDPTTGGVLASIGAIADVTLAEAEATIGFAGPRLVQRFTGEPLREGSHTAVGALGGGLVDAVVPSDTIIERLTAVLDVLAPDSPQSVASPTAPWGATDIDAWTAVTGARSPDRPTAPELLEDMSDELFYLRGDRAGGQDPAIATALARIAGRRVMVLAFDRAQAPGPRAYRKARRCIELAGRLNLPILTLIDTPGADPSERSEGGGLAWEIARTFEATLGATVPVLAIVCGEGGSGGALALACGDLLLAYEGSIFSVIAPESAAEIVWHDGGRGAEIAPLLKLTAPDLKRLGIADGLLAEPLEADSLRRAVAYHLAQLAEGDNTFPGTRLERWRRGAYRKAST